MVESLQTQTGEILEGTASKEVSFINNVSVDPIHAAAMMNKKRGLAGRFTANLSVST